MIACTNQWTQTRPDQSVNTWTFGYSDNDELETAQQTLPLGAQQTAYAYGYDAAGNRVQEQRGEYRKRFTQNARNQLTKEDTEIDIKGSINQPATAARFAATSFPPPSSVPLRKTSPLVIDGSGQMTASSVLGKGRNIFEFSFTDASQQRLFKRYETTISFYTPKDYAYDANGNLVTVSCQGIVLKTYAWDRLNRLVAWGDGTGVLGRFVYDGLGRRILEQNAAGTATVRQWVWDGAQPIQERDGSGTVTRRWFDQGELRNVSGSLAALLQPRPPQAPSAR